MRSILKYILTWLSHQYIRKYQPQIVAITGNVGKTSTKEMIGAVLKRRKKIRVTPGNLNNEFGIPLVILSDPLQYIKPPNQNSLYGDHWTNYTDRYYSQGSSLWFWLSVIFGGVLGLFTNRAYPEVLVLEFGADKPGDIHRLARQYKPDVAVVTVISRIPVHVEQFGDPEGVAKEKGRVVEALGPADYAVLNHDDDWVWLMKDRTKANIITFGFKSRSDITISDFKFKTDKFGIPEGVSFILHQGDHWALVHIKNYLGKSLAWSSAAAAAVGVIFGMNLKTVAEALQEYKGSRGRLRILPGIKSSWIIDDTYNAAPASTRLALETLRDLPRPRGGGRKIAVLGDMLELGVYTEQAHREIGSLAGEVVDILVCVGAAAGFIAETASAKIPPDSILRFDTSLEARLKVQELIKENDLVLVKGSQGMRMEKVVEEIMAEPERKSDLLVRQSEKWLKN